MDNEAKEQKLKAVKDKYSMEIGKINYIFSNLEKGHIYDPLQGKHSKGDGLLATNTRKLKELISDLFVKVVLEEESIKDTMFGDTNKEY